MLDSDLAQLYGVATMRLNEQVKRNKARFPEDFMFQLTKDERDEVIANCDNLSRLKFSYRLPYVFTEHGVAMLSSVLKSPRAIEMNIYIIRAFIRLRELLASNKDLVHEVEEIKREQGVQNQHINRINRTLSKLIEESAKPKAKIGFSNA